MNTPRQTCLGAIAAEAAPAGAPGRLRLTPPLRPDPARRSTPHATNATIAAEAAPAGDPWAAPAYASATPRPRPALSLSHHTGAHQ